MQLYSVASRYSKNPVDPGQRCLEWVLVLMRRSQFMSCGVLGLGFRVSGLGFRV